jgi:hypothetical protein
MDEPLYTEEQYAIRELKAVKAIVPVGERPSYTTRLNECLNHYSSRYKSILSRRWAARKRQWDSRGRP